MDEYFLCFCGKRFEKKVMKSSHYRECPQFKIKFKDLDDKISRTIKRYVDSLDQTKDKEYIDRLLLLKFFLKRYVDLVGELIKKNIKKDEQQYDLSNNQFISKKWVNVEIKKFESYNPEHIKNKKRDKSQESLNRKLSILDNNFAEFGNIKDKTFEKIFDYCEKVYEKDTNFDEELLNVMSFSLSALTSKECFLIVSNDNQNKRLLTRSDDKRKFYGFKYKDTNFFVLLY